MAKKTKKEKEPTSFTKKTKFADIKDSQERHEMLLAECTTTEMLTIKRVFSEEQIESKKARIVEMAEEILTLEEEKKEFNAEWNKKTKPLKTENQKLVQHVKDGFLEQGENTFCFANQEEGVMEYYDEDGMCVKQRELLPSERQTSLKDALHNLGSDNEADSEDDKEDDMSAAKMDVVPDDAVDVAKTKGPDEAGYDFSVYEGELKEVIDAWLTAGFSEDELNRILKVHEEDAERIKWVTNAYEKHMKDAEDAAYKED